MRIVSPSQHRPIVHDDSPDNGRPDDAMELTVEVLGGHVGIALELLVDVDDGGGEDGEERTEAEDDDVTDGLGEGGVALEVTFLAGVLGEGGDELIGEPLDDEIGRHGGWVVSFVKTAVLALCFFGKLGRMSSTVSKRSCSVAVWQCLCGGKDPIGLTYSYSKNINPLL
jgi:hypothetical protein